MSELIRLADGGRFLVRPMEAADAERVRDVFAALSPASLRLRFFTPVPRLTPGLLADLTAVEPGRRIVLLAFETGTGRLAGEVRAIRGRDDPTTADVAVSVADEWQRRGLGGALLRTLRWTALTQGVERLAGHVLVDNPAAQALVRSAGARLEFDEPGVLRFEIPLVGTLVAA